MVSWQSPMSKVWKILALLLVITVLVWLASMWRWQSTQTDPSGSELAVQLGLLPVLLTAALVATLWSVKRLRHYAAAPTPLPASTAQAAPTASAAERTAAAERSATVRVLAASAQVRAGASWQSAMTSIAEGSCKAELDAALKDDDGIAVFTAPMPDLSTDFVATALDDLVARLARETPAEWTGHVPRAEVVRALTMLSAAGGAMQEAIEARWPALQAPPSRPSPGSRPVVLPTVSLQVGLPARWSQADRQLATAWIERWLDPVMEDGFKAAGQSRAMAGTHPALHLQVHAVESAEALWRQADQQLLQWHRERQPGLLWLMAADSLVGEHEVAVLGAAGELFSGRQQRGRVPGEAAAMLLLASDAWREPAGAPAPLARLHRTSLVERDKSADASGRISPQALVQAVTDTLQASGVDAATVQHLTTDADHRASRTAEVFETAQQLLPALDTSEHALRLGLGCGDLGIARLPSCVALAAAQVQEAGTAGLVLAAQSPLHRMAVLLTPIPPPVEDAAALKAA